MSKKKDLAKWMYFTRVFKTHEVIKWGMDNFYNSSDRTKRLFLESGLIKKIDNELFNESRESSYEIVDKKLFEYIT